MLNDIYPYIDTLLYFSRRLNSINYIRDNIRIQEVEWRVKRKVSKAISKSRNAGLLTIQPPDAADSPRTLHCTSYFFSHEPKYANLWTVTDWSFNRYL